MNKGAPDDATAIQFYSEHWGLTPDGAVLRTPSSTLVPVLHQGLPAMLKIAHIAEEQIGNGLMAWWDGAGAAPILAHDARALLMQRATGLRTLHDLSRHGKDDEATLQLCLALTQLHAPRPVPLPALTPLTQWFQDLLTIDAGSYPALQHSARTAQSLLAQPQDECVLHGDMHHGNLLDFDELGWLAIDPKGLYGERGFDYANLFCNPEPGIAARAFAARLEQTTRISGLDRRRLLEWILAWSGLSSLWLLQDGEDASGRLFIGKMAAQELCLT